MPVSELLARTSSAELTEWQAYERVTGQLGDERHDVLASLTAYYVVAALHGKKSKARLDKMIPQWDRKPAQDWREMKLVAQAMAKTYGGEFRQTV